MDNVLGIFAIGPNPSACLLRQGRVIAMAEEERLVRSRDIELSYPLDAIAHCEQAAGLSARDVDAVAYAWDATRYPGAFLAGSLRQWVARNTPLALHGVDVGDVRYKALISLVDATFHDRAFVRWRLESGLAARSFGEALPPLHFVPHHLAHAASAFYCSGFEEAAILTVDRNGEDICTTIWEGRGVDITSRRQYRLPDSLGWFYSGFTDFLGFRPEYQEGHVMGLAAYGEPNGTLAQRVADVLQLRPDGSYHVDSAYFYHGASHGHSYTPRMIQQFGPPRLSRAEPLEQRHKDLACAVQQRLELALLGLARQAVQLTEQRRLCLAGGVALNCVANSALLERGVVDQLFVQPASNDAGASLGAAQVVAARHGSDPRFTMSHAFYGPAFTAADAEAALARSGLAYQAVGDIEQAVARLLAEGCIVGWFDGAMEIGPRALGARSILADPREAATAQRVNAIKGRAPWRPLAPAILERAASAYFEGAAPTPFMTVASRVRPEMRDRIAAVVHVDGTTRPQVVREGDNPRLWRLLCAFEELTQMPVLLNTSFNVADEPIVCSPRDAVRTFVSSDLDVLAISGFLAWKPSVSGVIQYAISEQAAKSGAHKSAGRVH